MPSLDDTSLIAAPPEEVWKLLYDPAGSPSGGRAAITPRRSIAGPATGIAES